MSMVRTDDLLLAPDRKSTTAAEAVAQVRQALNHLVGPQGLDIVPLPAQPSRPAPTRVFKDADLHALSRVPLSSARRNLTAALHALRAAAVARDSWEPGHADRLLRVKHDAVVKHRAVKASKAALKECRRLAVTADPFATPVALAIQRLRSVAEATGATTAEDNMETLVPRPAGEKGEPIRRKDKLLTICGTKFLADFHFFDVSAVSISVKVKFRHLTADDSEIGDEDVDESFAALIQKQDFDALKAAFQKLMAQEELSDAVSKEISLIDAFRCFEDDLVSAQQAEKKLGFSDDDCMRFGHGVLKRSALGLNVEFMKGHNALLGVEDAIPAREICVSRCHPSIRQDVQPGSAPSAVQFEFAQAKMVSVNAQYVLQFKEPVIVCLSIAQNLERVGRGDEKEKKPAPSVNQKGGVGSREVFSTRGDSRSEDRGGRRHHWPSLQTLLAPKVFAAPEQGEVDASGRDVKGESVRAPSKEVVKKREHWSQQATEFITAAALPKNEYMEFSHSGSDTVSGLAVHRVPLGHPKNVKPIFSLIRQQIVFNELFQSCFANPVYPDQGRSGVLKQPVEVVLCDAPSFMSMNLYDTTRQDILSVAISVELGGDINVNLKLTSEQSHPCSDAKASAILRACRNIPITLMTIVKLGQRSAARTAE